MENNSVTYRIIDQMSDDYWRSRDMEAAFVREYREQYRLERYHELKKLRAKLDADPTATDEVKELADTYVRWAREYWEKMLGPPEADPEVAAERAERKRRQTRERTRRYRERLGREGRLSRLQPGQAAGSATS